MFPDWFANNTQAFWTEALRNWSQSGVNYSGIWLDMNEASSFCDGSWYVASALQSGGATDAPRSGTGIDISNTSVPFLLPGVPGNLVSDYPEG